MILLIGKCHRHISIFTYSLGFISLFHGSNGVLAAPQGGQVLSGEAGISQASVGGQPVTTITQSSNKANQAKLSAAGVSLSWTGPHHWSASLSLGRALGKTPSLLSGSSSLHTSAWLELVKKFN